MGQPKIVVGYVMTDEGEAALHRAVEEAKIRDAELVIIHSARGDGAESDEEIIEYREVGEDIKARLHQEGVSFRLTGYVRGNTPAEDLARVAEDEKADLIVIGIRRRSTLGKLLLGSNAQEIIMTAPCPVLTVRAV